MEINEILKKLRVIINESTGINESEIELNKTLSNDLHIDSIDMVDILFELETEYDIELKMSDIEKRTKEELGGEPYEENSMITAKGIEALKKHLPEVDQDQLVEGLTIHELVKLLTVHSLCKLIQYQLEETA